MKKLLFMLLTFFAYSANAASGWNATEMALPNANANGPVPAPAITLSNSYVLDTPYHWAQDGNAYKAWVADRVASSNPTTYPAYSGWEWSGVNNTSFYDLHASNLVVGDTYTITETGGIVSNGAPSSTTGGVFTVYDTSALGTTKIAQFAAGTVYGYTGDGTVSFTATSTNESIKLAAPEIDANLAGISLGLLLSIMLLFNEAYKKQV